MGQTAALRIGCRGATRQDFDARALIFGVVLVSAELTPVVIPVLYYAVRKAPPTQRAA
jgi:hypothetical protein